jgi:prepilin-type N-terminal cleavage/methylation domain-containing protein
MKHLSGSNSGFTLLEIVIAITILASLAYLSAMSISNTISAKTQLQTRIDVSSEIRTAVKVIEKDIRSAFNYNNFNYDLLVEIKADQKKAANPNANPNANPDENAPPGFGQPPPPPPVPTPTPAAGTKTVTSVIDEYLAQYKKATDQSQFLGTKDTLNFTSLNHVRRFQDAQESDQMEVGYYLAECRELLNADKRSSCLWRRESPFIDDKVDEGGAATVLIENVKALEFQYKTKKEMEEPDSEWRDTWTSDAEKGADAATKGKFPDVVKVSIEAEIKGRLTKDVLIIPIDFVNNKEPKKNAPANPADPAAR